MAKDTNEVKIQNLVIGLGVILLIIAGVFYFRSKNSQEMTPSPTPEEILVQQEGTVKKTGEIVQPLTEEEIKTLHAEIDTALADVEAINLKDTIENSAKAEAKKLFINDKFYYKLTATGLKLVDKGYYYEGWLVKDDQYLSLGRLAIDESGNGSLYYTSSVDRSDYLKTVITLEPEDGNSAPGNQILEGSW